MKSLFFFCFSLLALAGRAQDDDCKERLLAKEGAWKKLSQTVKAPAADYAIQTKFYNALHQSVAGVKPRGWQGEYSGSFQPKAYGNPFPEFTYSLYAMMYSCDGANLTLNHETNTHLFALFNRWENLQIYEDVSSDNELGFEDFRGGMPTEIQPGVWQFPDESAALGFGNEGIRKVWLFTYPGQLPWQWTTRQEFLQKRRSYLLQQLKNQEGKSGNERWVGELKTVLEKINDRLQSNDAELNKPAIVVRSTQMHNEFLFVEPNTRGSVMLIKPNPAYFKKGLPPAAPQFLKLDLTFNPKHPVSAEFARNVQKQLDLTYLQSFIGKSAPGASNASSSVPNTVANPSTNKNSTAPSEQRSNEPKKKENTAKPLTPQGPLASKGIFLSGTLSAPAGVPVTIGYNGGADLTITPPKGAGNLYNTTPIKFTKPINETESYNVLLKKMAGNMKGVVYRGSGKAPNGINEIKIGVDYKYELVSRSSDDVFSSFYETAAPAVGGMGNEEGRYVVFVSWTKGFVGNDGKYRQIFWRDRNTGITRMVSTAPDGSPANESSALPSISADGQTVVFESRATNLVPGDENKVKDIFLWRAQTGKVELVSVPNSGGWSNGESYEAQISGNGLYVVFTSDAANLTEVPKGRSRYNVFLRSLPTGKTEMLSIVPSLQTGGDRSKASISHDGSRVTFCSPIPNLVAGDNNSLWDIFLWERGKQGLRRISLTQDGKERNQGDESSSRHVASTLSGNGRYMVYSTTATNMVPGDNLKYQDVFVYDIETGKLQVASFTDDGQPGNGDSPIDQGDQLAISHDGTWVAFPTKATNLGTPSSNIILFNTQTGKKQIVTDTRGSYVGRPAISYSGSYVVFGKGEPMDLRSGVAFGSSGIYAYFTGNGPCRDCKE